MTNRVPPGLVQTMGQVSNRTIISRLKEWGAVEAKVGSEWTIFYWKGDTFKVQSAHYHRRNSMHTLLDMLQVMGLTWHEFIATDLSPITTEQLNEAREVVAAINEYEKQVAAVKQRRKEARKRKATHDKEQSRMAQQQPVLALASEPPPEETTIHLDQEVPVIRERIINRVLDLLVQTGEPMSVRRIHESLVQTGLQPRYHSVGGACLRLRDQGVVDRIKPGVYQAKPVHQRQDVRVGVQGAVETGLASLAQPAAPTPQRPAQPHVEDRNETINEVLDLIFPAGFKAKHLPLIDAWRRATIDLMDEIDRG